MRSLLRSLLFIALVFFSLPLHGQRPGRSEVVKEHFLINGKAVQIMSGELHYPRIPREYWRDRLLKARAMGLNTVCTYVFWNVHEPSPGTFDFTGDLDVAAFVREAADIGLWVIIRPGPYVCSEWDLGGLPSWLLKDRDIRLRCSDPRYERAAAAYLRRLGQELTPLQIDRGGPIILVQLENEYGSYGNDKAHLAFLQTELRSAGFSVPLFTSDGPAPYLLRAGTLPDVLPVVNFGGEPRQAFEQLAQFRPGIPHMNGEFWCGWFTHWGDSTWGSSNTVTQTQELQWMLANGKSFNLYMFHGGTNFGWMAGANFGRTYEPDVTSYDYDAPLDEMGNPTAKFRAFRDILAAFQPPGSLLPQVPAAAGIEVPEFTPKPAGNIFSNLPAPIRLPQPKSMEELGQDYGYILYRTRLVGPTSGTLMVTEPHDYALVFIDGRFIDTLDRTRGKFSVQLPQSDAPEPVLDILVEAMGRVNFGQHLIDRKGITDRATLRGVTLMNWEAYLLPMDAGFRNALSVRATDGQEGPRFFRATFSTHKQGDTFLDMSRWSKGAVWLNGRHLGRYWNVGPQRRLYVPAPWLREGENEVVVFDLHRNMPAPIRGLPRMSD